jgi:transposase
LKARKPRTKKISHGALDCIRYTINTNPFSSWKSLAHNILSQHDVRVSRSTTGRALKSLGYTRKKARRVVNKQHDPADIMNFCNSYIENENELICIDESCFYVGEQGKFGYAMRGERLHVRAQSSLRRRKYTLVMAISKTGIVHHEILEHNCKTTDFVKFIQHPRIPQGATLLMDNVQFHKSSSVKDALHLKNCKQLFIPPYSPRTNAIENVFGVLKCKFRNLCPAHADASCDYKSLFENVLHEKYTFNAYFDRVNAFVHRTLDDGGVGFVGYD